MKKGKGDLIKKLQIEFQRILYLYLNNEFLFWPESGLLNKEEYKKFVFKNIAKTVPDLLSANFNKTASIINEEWRDIDLIIPRVVAQFYVEFEKSIENYYPLRTVSINRVKKFHLRNYAKLSKLKYAALESLLRSVVRNKLYFSSFLVIGSFGDGKYIPGWSDLDIFVIIKKEYIKDYKKLIRLKGWFEDNLHIPHKIDKYQLHGYFTITELDAQFYPESIMPINVLKKGACMHGEKIDLRIRDDYSERGNIFKSLEIYLNKISSREVTSLSDKELKLFMHRAFIFPSFFLQAVGISTYKAQSFSMLIHFFPLEDILFLEKLTMLMKKWKSTSFISLRKNFSKYLEQFNILMHTAIRMIKDERRIKLDYPIRYNGDDYREAEEEFLDNWKKIDALESIYSFGSLVNYGISDLDYIVVVKDNPREKVEKYASIKYLSQKSQYIICHDPFIVPESIFKHFNKLYFIKEKLNKKYGSDLFFLKLSNKERYFFSIIQLNYYFHHFYPHTFFGLDRKRNKFSARFYLMVTNAMKYSVEIYNSVNRKSSFKINDHIFEDIKVIREEWFTKNADDNYLRLALALDQSEDYIVSFAEELNTFMAEHVYTDIKFPDIKILAVYKNMGIVFYNSKLISKEDIFELTEKYLNEEGKVFSFLPEYFLIQLLHFSGLPVGLGGLIGRNLVLNFKKDFRFKRGIFKYQKEFLKHLDRVDSFYNRCLNVNKLHNYYQDRDVIIAKNVVDELFNL